MGARDIRDSILNMLNEESAPDYILIHKATINIRPLLEKIAGVLVVSTFLMLLIIIALEVYYLAMPNARSNIDKYLVNSEGFGRRPLQLILGDAIASYRVYITENRQQNLFYIYLKRKILVILFYGICLSFLMGNGEVITRILRNIFDYVIEPVLESLFAALRT